MACGCGRSPTGKCIGWHKLTEEEYQTKLAEYNARQKEKYRPESEEEYQERKWQEAEQYAKTMQEVNNARKTDN